MLEYIVETLEHLERDDTVVSRDRALQGLRALGLDDFGLVLLTMPNRKYEKLSRLLPEMASATVQRNWTGDHGEELLRKSTTFVRTLSYNFNRTTGRTLDSTTVLDFGCGYGRLARLLYYFVDENRLFGVDPWSDSIDLCRQAGLGEQFVLSDYLPLSLPVGTRRFDLIYAFSVFTHLSRRATLTALSTLRNYVTPDGMLAITIRPVEYWAHDAHTSRAKKAELTRQHREEGFAFNPHLRAPVDGDITYGDSSASLEWLEQHCPQWRLTATDRSLDDPFQRYLFLTPR